MLSLATADPDISALCRFPCCRAAFSPARIAIDQANKVIISRELARQYFPGENPIGKHLHVPAQRENIDYEVVGEVGDTLWQVGQPIKADHVLPYPGWRTRDMNWRGRSPCAPLPTRSRCPAPVQKQIAALDPELPVSDVLTMEQVIGQSLGNQSFSATLVLAFAILSLVLASVGLYGVLSYLMTQRMTEIGIRIALGASASKYLRLMLLDGLRPALFGLAFGLAASAAAVRLIRSMLYETQPLDPAVFAGVAATLLLVAALACLVPAWRASRLDPMQALRTE